MTTFVFWVYPIQLRRYLVKKIGVADYGYADILHHSQQEPETLDLILRLNLEGY